MKLKKILENIWYLLFVIVLIVVIIAFISEIVTNVKIVKQDKCVVLNGKDYCEVK